MNKVIYELWIRVFFQIWTSLMQIDGETIFWRRSTQKYPHFLILSESKIHQFNEPASGTYDLIIAFESDRTNADFRFIFFHYLY